MIAPHESAAEALQRADAAVPLVAVEAGPEASVPVIAVDQVAGAAAATRHLLELGHRTVCHVTGPREFLEAQQRARGWRETLAGAGASVPEPLPGDWSASSGYQLGRRLAENEEVSAIFVANDQIALGVLRAMHEAGRRVTEQVSVVGFDDIPEAPYFTPPLTTVRQDFDRARATQPACAGGTDRARRGGGRDAAGRSGADRARQHRARPTGLPVP